MMQSGAHAVSSCSTYLPLAEKTLSVRSCVSPLFAFLEKRYEYSLNNHPTDRLHFRVRRCPNRLFERVKPSGVYRHDPPHSSPASAGNGWTAPKAFRCSG